MADLSGLPDDIVYVLRNGKLPPGVTLPDAEAEPVEDPDEARFRERYHKMVEEKIAEWLAAEDYDIGALTDFRGQNVPAEVREQIEADCNRQIQYEWRQFLQQQEEDDEDW
ncbi:hypothetical protein MABM_26500 [Mycobacteroides abscessus]|uniref:hypothetical protein n=1 Tax=Mycobacteroides abscessus TaxID=36809 RepID=UPI0003AA7946|nr:hypothetical protein [Mycobacteroides abscessus]BBZ82734.1 hypothetical protein MABM_26500 [Mycobacteroides abscessus]